MVKRGVYAFEKAKQGPKVDFIHMKGILCFVKGSKAFGRFYGVMKGFMHQKDSEMHEKMV